MSVTQDDLDAIAAAVAHLQWLDERGALTREEEPHIAALAKVPALLAALRTEREARDRAERGAAALREVIEDDDTIACSYLPICSDPKQAPNHHPDCKRLAVLATDAGRGFVSMEKVLAALDEAPNAFIDEHAYAKTRRRLAARGGAR